MQNHSVSHILGIEKPVIQGPLSWLTDARLVAAVSNAGGLGVFRAERRFNRTNRCLDAAGNGRKDA